MFFPTIIDAIAVEKQLKRWSHAKKQALIDEDALLLKRLSRPKYGPDGKYLRIEGKTPE